MREYLEGSSFNRVEDLMSLLKRLKLDPTPISGHCQSLGELMKRRHAIVHRVDRSSTDGDSTSGVQDIDPLIVMDWAETVREVTDAILLQIIGKLPTKVKDEILEAWKLAQQL